MLNIVSKNNIITLFVCRQTNRKLYTFIQQLEINLENNFCNVKVGVKFKAG